MAIHDAPQIEIHLLGEIQVTVGGALLGGKRYAKVLALLAYLAVESGRRHSREALADLLWPALGADEARTNLRQALYYLRRAFGNNNFLVTDRTSVGVSEGSYWLDLEAFLAAENSCPHCTAGQPPCSSCLNAMARRMTLYRGDFLAGLTVEEVPAFEEWRAKQREWLHCEALGLLERLRAGHEQRGELEQALTYARRYTLLEPWDEEGQRQLMALLARNGQKGAALAQYESCREILARDLGLEPEAATYSLMERIRNDGLLPSPQKPVSATVRANRRQATIVCGRFIIRGENDPEIIAEQLRTPRQLCSRLMQRHGGQLAQTHGGSFFVYFGYPIASESAAVQAVRASLQLVQEAGVGLCIGIHTGVIVTGNDPALPDTAGVASNIASRLCDAAEPEGVVISESTRRLIEGFFHVENPHDTDASPVSQIYRVVGQTDANSRLDVRQRLTPLVGRRAELARLRQLWKESKKGPGQFILIRGEPGIGKSRLIRALRDGVANEPCTVRELHCFPEYLHSPLRPVVVLLETVFQLLPTDPPAVRRDKIRSYLAEQYPAILSETLPVVAALLDAADDDAPGLPPQSHKERTFQVLHQLLGALAARQPLLLIVEDLHWVDPSSLELLQRLASEPIAAPVLTVCSARPEFQAAGLSDETTVELGPLSDTNVSQLVDGLGIPLDEDARQRIVSKAEGVPLFAEEMALMKASTASDAEIPATLQYLLLARLDALQEARHTAQLAATIGRRFDRALLERVATDEPVALDSALRILREERIITPVDKDGSVFEFRHGLIQEAAYRSQTREDRRRAHHRIAEALECHFPQHAAQQPDQLARHFADAGAAAQALPRWLAAGRRALRASANAEAADHLRNGLALLKQLPADDKRREWELNLLLPLGQALLTLHGYGSAEAAAVYERAFALCHEQMPDRQRFEVLWGRWMVSSSREDSNFSVSEELASELLDAALASKDTNLLSYAHSANANIALWRGEFERACYSAETALASPINPLHPPLDGYDPHVSSLAHLSWARSRQGRIQEAREASERSIALAQTLEHADSLCFALIHAALLHSFLHDKSLAVDHAEQALIIADRYRLALWQSASRMVLGWAQAIDGDARGIERIQASAARAQDVMPSVMGAFLYALAEAYGFLDESSAQLKTIDVALETTAKVGDQLHQADLYRLRGEALFRLGHHEQADVAFDTALRIAKQQGAHAIARRIKDVLESLTTDRV